MKGKRLDVALVELGRAESRQNAQACIMSGIVYVDDRKVEKAGLPVGEQAKVEIRGKTMPYVSRGGLKPVSYTHLGRRQPLFQTTWSRPMKVIWRQSCLSGRRNIL